MTCSRDLLKQVLSQVDPEEGEGPRDELRYSILHTPVDYHKCAAICVGQLRQIKEFGGLSQLLSCMCMCKCIHAQK